MLNWNNIPFPTKYTYIFKNSPFFCGHLHLCSIPTRLPSIPMPLNAGTVPFDGATNTKVFNMPKIISLSSDNWTLIFLWRTTPYIYYSPWFGWVSHPFPGSGVGTYLRPDQSSCSIALTTVNGSRMTTEPSQSRKNPSWSFFSNS